MTNLEIGELVVEAAIRVLAVIATKDSDFMAKVGELVASFRDVYEQPTEADDLHRSLENLDINSSLPEDLCIMANLKALEIIRHALCIANIGRLEPSLITLLDAIVIPSVNSPFATIQASGLRCLGLYGTISKVRCFGFLSGTGIRIHAANGRLFPPRTGRSACNFAAVAIRLVHIARHPFAFRRQQPCKEEPNGHDHLFSLRPRPRHSMHLSGRLLSPPLASHPS